MSVLTPFPKKRDASQKPASSRDSNTQLHVMRDAAGDQTVVTAMPALAKPRALAAANPNGISMKRANRVDFDYSENPGANSTMLGMTPTRNVAPNATMIGHAPFTKDVEEAVNRIRFADGTKPQRFDRPANDKGGSHNRQVELPVRMPKLDQPATAKGEVDSHHAKSSQWNEFEKLGLTPKPITKKAQKLVVSGYRLLGFGILTLIVFVLVGYIATTVFYFFNTTWITPVAVSPSDEKVVQLQAELASQQNKRDQISDELDKADRAVAAEQNFQIEFAKAIKHDLEGRQIALGNVRKLANAAASARTEIKRTNDAFAQQSEKQMNAEYDAGLIDRQKMLQGNYQLAQISTSNLSLAERQASFEQRALELSNETRSLDAILSDKKATALNYDVLKIKRDYDTSKLALANELATRNSLKQSLERQDKVIGNLKKSPYLRAISDQATIAFVPYGNLPNAVKGVELYGCKLGMVMCHKVGTIVDTLPGEVNFKHPRRDKVVRGRMVELKLDSDEPTAAEDDILFVGAKPLWF